MQQNTISIDNLYQNHLDFLAKCINAYKQSIPCEHLTDAEIDMINVLTRKVSVIIPEGIRPSDFTRINSDVYGNPRYVCHFGNFVTDKMREEIKQLCRKFSTKSLQTNRI